MTNITRRNFVRSSALAAAACAAPSVAPAIPHKAEAKPSPIRLGLASYTFREFTRAQLIGFMKQLNVTDLNAKDVKDHLPMDPPAERLAQIDYEAAGIKLHAVGTVYFQKDEDDDIRMKFEYAKRAGVRVIVAGDPAVAALPRIEKYVKQYDIRIAIHNHGPEDKFFPSPLDVLKAVQNMDSRMGCCIDIGHCVGPRLYNMHAKDLTDFSAKESQVAVGDGQMPIRAIFQALIDTGYPGFVDLEYEVHGDDPMPGVIESFAYMRGVLAGMGYNPNSYQSAMLNS
jgi:hypothetical protein